jgi:hypothetical protein
MSLALILTLTLVMASGIVAHPVCDYITVGVKDSVGNSHPRWKETSRVSFQVFYQTRSTLNNGRAFRFTPNKGVLLTLAANIPAITWLSGRAPRLTKTQVS